jgi:hypothetical protein
MENYVFINGKKKKDSRKSYVYVGSWACGEKFLDGKRKTRWASGYFPQIF